MTKKKTGAKLDVQAIMARAHMKALMQPSEQNNCIICGKPTAPHLPYCETCFLVKLKNDMPQIKFLRADGSETEKPEECFFIQGIALRELSKK